MGKSSPNELNTPKQRRRSRACSNNHINNNNNKYLRPGALAQLRYNKKRILLLDSDKVVNANVNANSNPNSTPLPSIMSPQKFVFSSPHNLVNSNTLLHSPKTPRFQDFDCHADSESRLEALPMDLLVKVICHLHHDQLRAVFHVSQRIRMAVNLARQFHFNYTTPDRSHQEMLSTMTPLATEHWPFVSKREGKIMRLPSPHTPKAPRHGPRPPSRLKYTETKHVAAALFQEASLPVSCMVPSVLSKPICKNRVLFYEEELCQAVAQNKLG